MQRLKENVLHEELNQFAVHLSIYYNEYMTQKNAQPQSIENGIMSYKYISHILSFVLIWFDLMCHIEFVSSFHCSTV